MITRAQIPTLPSIPGEGELTETLVARPEKGRRTLTTDDISRVSKGERDNPICWEELKAELLSKASDPITVPLRVSDRPLT